jgi:tetratricopeptide (TPR) repeat protein
MTLANRSRMLRRRALTALAFVALAVAPVHAQSKVIELNEAAWKALRDGYENRAAALFGEALTMRPNDPVLLTGAGAAAHAQGKPRDAIARLKRAVEIDPRLLVASQLLGQIAYAEGDVDLAVRTYEQALKHAPGDPLLTSSLGEWRRETEAHRTFEERRFDRFRVMFEGRAEEALAAQATSILNTAFWRIGEKLGTYPSDPIVTVLYTEKQFRDITRAPDWSGGQYDGRIRIPAAGAELKPQLFEEVLVHELTHAMIDAIAPRGVPAWLDEGLAQYFDGSDRKIAERRLKARGEFIPLKYLERRGWGNLSAGEAQIAYDEALLAVGVMIDRPGFGWAQLLNTLGGGQPFERAIDSFGFTYADLERPFAR